MTKRAILFLSVISVSLLFVSLIPPNNSHITKPYLNGVFSPEVPGESGSWDSEDAYSNIEIASPLRILPFPTTSDVFILGKTGEIWQVSLITQEQRLVLDIKDRSFKLGEAGTVGMALHPNFAVNNNPEEQVVFVFYRTKPNPDVFTENGFNRLSKFYWDNELQLFIADSEEVLIQQYDRSSWHNGGGMYFGPDGFLYLALGDEGHEDFQAASTQRLDGGLFSGLIRIDVENDPAKSHPIVRQPLANAAAPAGWGETFSQGYSIPNDNPWQSDDGSTLEEYYALGVRSPYSTIYDEVGEKIWLLDVGSNKKEEINLVQIGDNLQWPYKEGFSDSETFEVPDPLIGNGRPPIFEYDRSVGSAVIGGGIYRGVAYPNLYGKYIFADFVQNKVMALTYDSETNTASYETLIANLANLSASLPEEPGISGVHLLEDGNIVLTVISKNSLSLGKLIRLKKNDVVEDPPKYLSDLNVFTNLSDLEVAEGIIPYTVNAPLWSDRAIKKRWMAIPTLNENSETQAEIEFRKSENWNFPEGSVFIKHFELPLTTNPDGPTVNLETRFFIIGNDQKGYGLTYKWNEDGTDAELLRIGAADEFDITENGEFLFNQTWEYPRRDQCMTCHTKNTNYILGVNTHQMNCNQLYCDLDTEMNQLEFLSQNEIINKEINDASLYQRSYDLDEHEIDLELRIRSYVDANCSHCHRLGGISEIGLELRYNLPLFLTNSVAQPTESQASNQNYNIIHPGDHSISELWIRDSSIEDKRMPPLATNVVNQMYVDSLAKWIDSLDDDSALNATFILLPNPNKGIFYARFSDFWDSSIQITIFDMLGRIVFEETSDSKTFYFEGNNVSPGTYLLLGQDSEHTVKRKFVIH